MDKPLLNTLLEKVAPIYGGTRFDFPAPSGDFNSRLKQRLHFRNESSLYKRACDATGKEILSMYTATSPFPVYSPEVWFGDTWDARDHGQDFDFDRPFFEQFLELRNKVPHLALISKNNENCQYTNIVGDCKNCYLIYGSIQCEDCYYGNPFKCRDCCDSLLLRNSELCLECMDSDKLYQCYACQNCSNSRDLMFCYEVHNSESCFGCAGLNRKKYCIFNQQYSEEAYKKWMAELDLRNPETLQHVMEKFESIKLQVPRRAMVGAQNENVTGDNIQESQNCENIFYSEKCQDVCNSFQLLDVKDSAEVSHGEVGELNYNCMGFYDNVILNRFCYLTWDNTYDLLYCGQCTQNVKNCFGSIGLRRAQYCILNKQYSKEDYEALMPKIIQHMQDTGEWGQFFPTEISPFSFEESVAGEIYADEHTQIEQEFRIIPQENRFYEHFGLELPSKHPKQRHINRLAKRNPMQLFERSCAKTGEAILTTYPPESPAIIYSEAAYLEEMY